MEKGEGKDKQIGSTKIRTLARCGCGSRLKRGVLVHVSTYFPLFWYLFFEPQPCKLPVRYMVRWLMEATWERPSCSQRVAHGPAKLGWVIQTGSNIAVGQNQSAGLASVLRLQSPNSKLVPALA